MSEFNTEVIFRYRDGNNHKFQTPVYILKGSLTKEQISKLSELYENADCLLVPNQISSEFKNACPAHHGCTYGSSNDYCWDDESDHSYHSLEIEITVDAPNVEIDAKKFYKKCIEGEFEEIDPLGLG